MRPGQDTEITRNGFTFKIKKFTPESACFWAFRMLGNLAFKDEKAFEDKVQDFALSMDRTQFKQFQNDCLRHVFVKLESGSHPLMNSEGNLVLTSEELPWDGVFELTLLSFAFTIRDFFAGARVMGIVQAIAGMFQMTGIDESSSTPSA